MNLPINSIIHGNCLSVMQEFPANSISAIVTDPPYGLEFMGKDWDHGVPGVPYWAEALRICKPGAFMLAFGGTRTYHRLACMIEDAGWEIRDCIMWMYGSGFPKSLDIGKAIDRKLGAEREVVGNYKRKGSSYQKESPHNQNPDGKAIDGRSSHLIEKRLEKAKTRGIDITVPATPEAKKFDGYGTALKPSYEPILVAMKPIEETFANNALKHGVVGINVDACRIKTDEIKQKLSEYKGKEFWGSGKISGVKRMSGSGTDNLKGRFPANTILSCYCETEHEPDCPVRLLDEQSGIRPAGKSNNNAKIGESGNVTPLRRGNLISRDDTGGASRFFYCAKASKSERNAGLNGRTNIHPTVKPLKLMQYLCKLVAPPDGGIILDPFAGSGTTLIACKELGINFIGIESKEEYCEIARARIDSVNQDLFIEVQD